MYYIPRYLHVRALAALALRKLGILMRLDPGETTCASSVMYEPPRCPLQVACAARLSGSRLRSTTTGVAVAWAMQVQCGGRGWRNVKARHKIAI